MLSAPADSPILGRGDKIRWCLAPADEARGRCLVAGGEALGPASECALLTPFRFSLILLRMSALRSQGQPRCR
jgi:hypothetical protein